MVTRIFVQCKTSEMPGPPDEKNSLMANAACQKVWSRNLNEDDRLTAFGGHFNQRCWLLIDSGPEDATEYTTVHLSLEMTGTVCIKQYYFSSTNCEIVLMNLGHYIHKFLKSSEPTTSSTQLIGQNL
jgi:hypothetical protein